MGRHATGGMHVDRVRSRHTSKSGETREYESRLLRRSFRKPDGKVGKETLANLSALPAAAVDAVEAVLKGKTLVEAGAAPGGHPVPRARACRPGARRRTAAGAAGAAGPALPGAGPGLRADHLPGGGAEAEAGDPGLVG